LEVDFFEAGKLRRDVCKKSSLHRVFMMVSGTPTWAKFQCIYKALRALPGVYWLTAMSKQNTGLPNDKISELLMG